MQQSLIGVDIGATSIKVAAFDEVGGLIALAVRPNAPVPQDRSRGWFVWDTDRIWSDVASALRQVCRSGVEPIAVAVTGFGADGAPFARDGSQRYPVISWHDARAQGDLQAISELIGERRLYDLTGYHGYPINTLCRWRWLQRHEPDALRDSNWLMMADIVAFRLCGEQRTDPTEASTTMAFDLATGEWAHDLLEEVGVTPDLPAPLAPSGSVLGTVTAAAAAATDLRAGIPVIAGGHDAEVGAFAAGPLPDGTVLDVSGTWEILMLRHQRFEPSDAFFEHGIDWEMDVVPGRFLSLALMPSGSVVNWVRDLAYGSESDWGALVCDAQSAPIGANGTTLVPAFVRGTGPYGKRAHGGSLEGLQTTTTRSDIARALFEGLCFQARSQLRVLERLHMQTIERLRVTGGAQRNEFWLQLKADTTGCVCEAVEQEELTLLGAALLAGVGAGVYGSAEEAVRVGARPHRMIEPDSQAVAAYGEIFGPLEKVLA